VFDDRFIFESDLLEINSHYSFLSNSDKDPLWELTNSQNIALGTNLAFDIEPHSETLTTKEYFQDLEVLGLENVSTENPEINLTTTNNRDYLTGIPNNAPLVSDTELFDLQNTTFNQTTPSSILINSRERHLVEGTLGADTFRFNSNFDIGFFSGNGNVEYGQGERDLLDLSRISSETVDLNLVSPSNGGILVNIGDHSRLFDEITLSNGSRILFEGIERIEFSDGFLNLVQEEPNDPLFDDQWNLHITGVHTGWRFTRGSDDVLIGIEDSGLGVNSLGNIHPDLGETTIFRNNFTDEFTANSPNSSHGTAVQGIIAANGDNAIGISGINWNSEVEIVDVIGGDNGDFSSVEATRQLISRARSQGQRLVINFSLGLSGTFGRLSPSHEGLADLVAANPDVLFVISSGNNGNSGREGLISPAILARNFDNAIAVGAAQGNRQNNGDVEPLAILGARRSFSQYGNGLTLLAPSGVVTTAAIPFFTNSRFTYHDYSPQTSGEQVFNGTSAAAPHVTGIVSLLLSVNPDLTGRQVKTILSETAFDLGQRGYDRFNGHGLVNADAAIRTALAMARA
jgi:subtilisin family serine protease